MSFLHNSLKTEPFSSRIYLMFILFCFYSFCRHIQQQVTGRVVEHHFREYFNIFFPRII